MQSARLAALTIVFVFSSSAFSSEGPYSGSNPAAMMTALPLKERANAIAYLLRILNEQAESYVAIANKCSAATMLGQLRAKEAVPALIAHLELRSSLPSIGGSLGRFPAAESLVEIGSPAIADLLASTAHPCTELRLKIIALVLVGIEPRESAKFRVQHAIEQYDLEMRESLARTGIDRTSKTKRSNLLQLVKLLEDENLTSVQNRPK